MYKAWVFVQFTLYIKSRKILLRQSVTLRLVKHASALHKLIHLDQNLVVQVLTDVYKTLIYVNEHMFGFMFSAFYSHKAYYIYF